MTTIGTMPNPAAGRPAPIDQLLDRIDRLLGLPAAPHPAPAERQVWGSVGAVPAADPLVRAAAALRSRSRANARPAPLLPIGAERRRLLAEAFNEVPAAVRERFAAAVATYRQQRGALDRLRVQAGAESEQVTLAGLLDRVLQAAELVGDESTELPGPLAATAELGASYEELLSAMREQLRAGLQNYADRVAAARERLVAAQAELRDAQQALAEARRLRSLSDDASVLAALGAAIPTLLES